MNTDQTNKTLQDVAETITEKPKFIEVDVKPRGWFHRLLLKAKIKPSKLSFEIRPQRVQNVFRIAGRAVKFDISAFSDSDGIGSLMKLMALHGEDIFYITACALQNDHREPTLALIKSIKNDFEMEDISTVLQVAVGQYNIPAFYNSIVLIVGVNALKMDQATPLEEGN